MKQNILKRFRCLCVPALVLGTFFASCTAELSSEVVQGGGGTAGESEVTLRLQVPAAGGGSQTRAVDDATENTVNDLYILAFKAGKDGETFDYYVTASKTATATEWTANLRVRQEQQTFVMVANAQGTPGKVNEQIAALAAGSVGHKKDDVLAKLTDALTAAEQTTGFNAAATTDHHPFTMYGQTATTVITADAGIHLDVRMHRIVARVQVSFTGDAAGTKFTPQEVSLYNYNDRARVIPDKLTETVDGKYEADPTIPAGAVRLPAKVDGKQVVPTYTVDADQKIEHQIYLFETAQPTGGTAQEQHVTRPCLIVKGVYENAAKPCYYRVDFAETGTKDYMDIVRNHTYNVTVQNVLAPGHDTPEEALTAQAANITATVVEWNDANIGDIDFDGEHMLGIATMKYELGRKGSNGGNLLQQVKASKGLKWTANLYAVDDQGNVDTNTQPAWISFKGGTKEASGTGNNQLQDLNFRVEKIGTNEDERRAVMRFTARNLMVEALVVQDQSEPVYINVKIGDRIITEAEFEENGGWCDEMTIEFGPEDTELTWRVASLTGINLNRAKVDGIEQNNLNGTAGPAPSEDGQSIKWQAEASPINSTADYETQFAVLTLIAKGKKGVVSKTIKLMQHKYGVTLSSNMIPCSGQPEVIKVKGNMNWVVEPVRATDPDGDAGYDEAVGRKYIQDYNRAEIGFPAEDFYSSNTVTLDTRDDADDTDGIKIKLRFTDKSRNKSVIKTVELLAGFIYQNVIWSLWGPVELTATQYNMPSYTPPDCPPEHYRMDSGFATALLDAGKAQGPLGLDDTKLLTGWSFSGFGYQNTMLTGTGANNSKSTYYIRGAQGDWGASVRREYRWSDVRPYSNSDSPLVYRSREAMSWYGTYTGTGIIGIECQGLPQYHKDANGSILETYYPYIILNFACHGSWNSTKGWFSYNYISKSSAPQQGMTNVNNGRWDFVMSNQTFPTEYPLTNPRWTYSGSNPWYVISCPYAVTDFPPSFDEIKLNTYYIKKIKDLN